MRQPFSSILRNEFANDRRKAQVVLNKEPISFAANTQNRLGKCAKDMTRYHDNERWQNTNNQSRAAQDDPSLTNRGSTPEEDEQQSEAEAHRNVNERLRDMDEHHLQQEHPKRQSR